MSKEFFKKNPGIKEYFESPDGVKFYTESAAKNYAKGKKLDPKAVQHFTKDKNSEEGESETLSEGKEAGSPAGENLSKMKKDDLILIATELGIEIKEETKAQIIELIEAARKDQDLKTAESTAKTEA